jgi:hypothetical protein
LSPCQTQLIISYHFITFRFTLVLQLNKSNGSVLKAKPRALPRQCSGVIEVRRALECCSYDVVVFVCCGFVVVLFRAPVQQRH